MDGRKLRDIPYSLLPVDLIHNRNHVLDAVMELVSFCKAVHLHGYPVPDSFKLGLHTPTDPLMIATPTTICGLRIYSVHGVAGYKKR